MFGLKFRQLFLLALLALAIFAATQFGPVYYRSFQFSDFVRQEVKFAVSARKSTEMVRAEIVQQARESGIPVGPHDIHSTRRGPAFTVEIEYRIPVDLKAFQQEITFHVTESGEIFENDRN